MKRKKHVKKLLLYMKKYRLKNLPVFSKLFLCFSLIFIFMVLLSVASYSFYSKDKQDSILSLIRQTNVQTLNKIDDYFSDLNSITKFPLFRQNGDTDFLRKLEQFDSENKSDLNFHSTSSLIFNDIFNYKKHIQSVFLFNTKGTSEYRLKGCSVYKQFNPVDENWFRESIANFGKPVIVSTFQLPYVSDMHNNPIYIFSMARGLVRVESSKVVGIILVNVSTDFLDELYQKMSLSKGQRVVIIDKNGYIVYDIDKSNITKKLDSNLLDIINQSPSKTANIKDAASNTLVSFASSELTGWRIINVIPINELNKDIIQMRNLTFAITIIIVIITFLLVYLISRQIVIPLKKLVILMNLVKNEDFNVKIKFNSKDEIGILAKSFNAMSKRLKRLINEVYWDKMKQKDLELQMLQNQINPHFLYNTLESISMNAEINDDESTSEMATALGKILRYSISKTNTQVTIREEINNLNDYILLQNARFKDIFRIDVHINPAIYENTIIKLVLQPIVENAINHGMESRRSGGIITVTGFQEDSHIIFNVSDNGKGMEADLVLKLNDYVDELNNSFKSIGLKNVNRRIKLHYGNEFGITVFSTPNEGTTVQVKIPVITNQ